MLKEKAARDWKKILLNMDMYIGGAMFSVLVCLVILNVILRYVFHTGIVWSEEVVLILFAWSTYLGVVASYRFDRHMRVEFIYNMLPKMVQKILDIGTDIVITGLNIYMVYLGYVLCSNAGVKATLVLRLPANVVNSVIVVAFCLLTASGIYKIVSKLRGTYHVENPFEGDAQPNE